MYRAHDELESVVIIIIIVINIVGIIIVIIIIIIMTSAMHVLQAYLTVAPFIAQFPEYKQALADHLLSTKLSHWERSLRELTSKALAALVPTQPGFFQSTAVDTLLPLCLNSILEVRHGAALGVGELTLALHSQSQDLDAERQAAVAGVVPAIEKARLYRGKGGELMRGAVCRSALHRVLTEAHTHRCLMSSVGC